jgi:ataxia telangiectasia mutated family protein
MGAVPQGEWTSAARRKTSMEINDVYFKPALDALGGDESAEQLEIYRQYARFAQSQYQALNARSDEMDRLRVIRAHKKAEHNLLSQRVAKGDRHLSNEVRNTTTAIKQDEQRLSEYDSARKKFLYLSLEMYAKLLALSDVDDDAVFRLVALWFSHHADDELNSHLAKYLEAIPSGSFVFLAHQLSARLCKSGSGSGAVFLKNLFNLVTRMGRQHPFHVLYQVYSLRQNNNKGKTRLSQKGSNPRLDRSGGGNPVGSSPASQTPSRRQVAEEVFATLRKDPKVGECVRHLETACEAFMELAKAPPDSTKGGRGPYKVPKVRIRKLVNIPIPVPTADLPVDPTCRYDSRSMPCIVRFSDMYTLAGGIHCPKIIDCYGSDGRKYKCLVSSV